MVQIDNKKPLTISKKSHHGDQLWIHTNLKYQMKFTTFLKHKLNVKFFYAVAHALHINWTYLSLLFELFWEIQPSVYMKYYHVKRCLGVFPTKEIS